MLHSLKKYTKKLINKWTIAMSICLVSILSLFAMTKTYAYDYNSNTNQLVGNNLLQNATFEIKTNNGTDYTDLTYNNISLNLDNNNDINITLSSGTISIYEGQNLANYLYIYTNVNPIKNQTNNMLYTQFVVLIENSATYSHTFNLKVTPYLYAPLENIKYVTSNTGYGDTIASLNNYGIGSTIGSMFMTASYRKQIGGSTSNYTYCFGLDLPSIVNNYSFGSGTIKLKLLAFNNDYDIDYAFNNNQTFYPYSSIEDLQQRYNTLIDQYNSLEADYVGYILGHSHTNTEYNNLLIQLNTLQLQYDTYVATHSYTDTEYNTLNNQYQNLQTSYNSLLASYNDLESRFNEVIGESSSAMYFALNGATANLYTDVSGVKTLLASDTVSINENYMTFDNSCIPNINTYMNGYDSEDTTTYPNPYCYIEINLNMSINSSLLFTFDNTILDVDITLSSTISDVTNVYKRDSSLNAYQLSVNNDRLSFNKITYDGIYMPDYISIDFSLQIDGYSYSIGYNKGVESQQSRINGLTSSVNNMQSSINALRASNAQLQDSLNNTFGWKNLFFAMADTPFKTVSNVLGFELFGLNLFTAFIGMITVFAIIWLLKKFI